MAAQTKAVVQTVENSALKADDRWSPVHMMMFCTVVSAILWAGIFALFRWIFS